MKFTCANYDLGRGIFRKVPRFRWEKNLDPSPLTNLVDSIPSDEERLEKYKEVKADLCKLNIKFSDILSSDIDKSNDFLTSSTDFLQTLIKESEEGELDNKSLYSKLNGVSIMVDDAKNELSLNYPNFLRNVAQNLKSYIPKTLNEKKEILQKIENLNTVLEHIKKVFISIIENEYSKVIEAYCSKYWIAQDITRDLLNDQGQRLYETHVDLVLDIGKNRFRCDNYVSSRSKRYFDELNGHKRFLRSLLKQLCLKDEETLEPGMKKFKEFPKDTTFYLGSTFLPSFQNCLSGLLKEDVYKSLTSPNPDLFQFATSVGRSVETLMEMHSVNKLMHNVGIIFKDSEVTLELSKNGLLLFNWNPILDLRVLQEGKLKKTSFFDEHSANSEIFPSSMETIRAINDYFKKLQSSYIRYVVFNRLKKVCRI